MKNKITAQLLKENRKALRALHDLNGFDFQREYFIYRGVGRFTFNTVQKAIAEGIDGDICAVMLIRSSSHFRKDKLSFVKVGKYKFDPVQDVRGVSWDWKIGHYYGIGDFEDDRKKTTDHYYIIAQRSADMAGTEKRHVDFMGRFRYIPGHDRNCGDGKGAHWINGFRVMALDGSASVIDYSTEKMYFCLVQYDKTNTRVSDLIDNSGYLLASRRNDRRKRAERLRRDRAAAQAAAADFSEQEKEIEQKIASERAFISDLLNAAKASYDFETVEKMAHNVGRALRYFEQHKKRAAEKQYASLSEAQREFDSIRELLERGA